MILPGQARPEGREHQVAGALVDLSRGFADDGKALVDGREGAVAEGVGLLDVGGDVLVRLLEEGEDGLGEGLVG